MFKLNVNGNYCPTCATGTVCAVSNKIVADSIKFSNNLAQNGGGIYISKKDKSTITVKSLAQTAAN